MMKKQATVLLSALLLTGATTMPSIAQEEPAREAVAVRGEGAAAAASRETVSAVVTAVDAETRMVTLKPERGDALVMQAGPEIRNFDRIKVGDTVVATYMEAAALELKKKTEGSGLRERRESTTVIPGAEGQAAGTVARKIVLVADVLAVDPQQGSITLRGPKQTQTLAVRDPSALQGIEVGDQVEASYVEALALELKPADTGRQ